MTFGDMITRPNSYSRQYSCWSNIKDRCLNKKSKKYIWYGGRGITIDKKWMTFAGFWEDMKDGYRSDLTIDRINNNGNYCKENCRWATTQEQNSNMSTNIPVLVNGVKFTFAGLARLFGLTKERLHQRLYRDKMNLETALTKPKRKYKMSSLNYDI